MVNLQRFLEISLIGIKTNLDVSSIEYGCCLFDEGQVGIRYGSCSSHEAIIPLL